MNNLKQPIIANMIPNVRIIRASWYNLSKAKLIISRRLSLAFGGNVLIKFVLIWFCKFTLFRSTRPRIPKRIMAIGNKAISNWNANILDKAKDQSFLHFLKNKRNGLLSFLTLSTTFVCVIVIIEVIRLILKANLNSTMIIYFECSFFFV